MICTSIQNRDLEGIFALLDSGDIEMAEIRLDRCPLSEEEIETLFAGTDVPLVATCRIAEVAAGQGCGRGVGDMANRPAGTFAGTGNSQPAGMGAVNPETMAEARLLAAIRAGAAYADLELEAPALMGKHIRDACRECGTLLIRSWHDFTGTPPQATLLSVEERCRRFGADVIKIVTTATSRADADRVLALYDMDSAPSPAGGNPSVKSYAPGHKPVPRPLIAFAMGDAGRDSRLECLRRGAPFTYAALSAEEATAPGQWTAAEMSARLYGPCAEKSHFAHGKDQNDVSCAKQGISAHGPDDIVIPCAETGHFAHGVQGKLWRVDEPIAMPSSKSFAQRAIVAAALAEGTSRLAGYSPCGDNESALAVARALGAEVTVVPAVGRVADGAVAEGAGETIDMKTNRPGADGLYTLIINGIGAAPGNLSLRELHTGESGFLTRMMIPLLATLASGPVRVTGEKTLLNRPLAGAHDIMASFGVRLYPEDVRGGRKEDCYLPLTVQGPLLPGRAEVNGKGGSQLISGLLAALPLCAEKSTVYVVDPKSIPYLFITLDVLKQFGIRVGSEMEGGADFMETGDWSLCTGVTFRVKPGQRYQASDFRIEGDWSSAANFLVAGAVFGDLTVSGLDTSSLQADLSIMDILTAAGASLSQLEDAAETGEPEQGLAEDEPSPGESAHEGKRHTTGPLHVQKAPLRPFEADLNNCPDLFPIVSVLAAFCPGESRLQGVNRLTHKETDRAAAIRDMLLQMGVAVQIDDDEMTITGMSLSQRLLTDRLLRGGRYTSHGDHRMVMALKVAELGADGPVEIDDEACVAKSYPGFHRDWAWVKAAVAAANGVIPSPSAEDAALSPEDGPAPALA